MDQLTLQIALQVLATTKTDYPSDKDLRNAASKVLTDFFESANQPVGPVLPYGTDNDNAIG